MALSGSFALGQEGESCVLRYMMSKGRILTEVGALRKDRLTGKAPAIYLPQGKALISPDFLTINPSVTPTLWTAENIWYFPFLWTEVKHKQGCTFYRKKQRWQTGIDKRHYEDYVQVDAETNIPVWLFFFHSKAVITQDVPTWALPCPTGLFACPISQKPSDEWSNDNYQKTGYRDMVYWGIHELKQLATAEEVLALSQKGVA